VRLSIKIPLYFGIIIAVIAVGITIVSTTTSSRILRETLMDTMYAEAYANSEIVSERLGRQLDTLSEFANRAVMRSMDWEQIQPYLVPVMPRIDALDLALVFPNGNAFSVSSGSIIEVGDRDYIRSAFRGERRIQVVVNRRNDVISTMFAVPIYQGEDHNSNIVGVLLCNKDGMLISDMVVALNTSMNTGHYLIVDVDGSFIGHQNRNMVREQFNPVTQVLQDPSLRTLADMITTAYREREGYANYIFNGEQRIGFYTYIADFPWKIIYSIAAKELDNEIKMIRDSVMWMAFGLLFIALIIAFFIGRSISKPIHNVAETLKDIAEGEGDLTHTIVIHSKDEIGDLAKYFNETLDKIKNLVINIRAEANSLTATGSDLASNMNQTAAAVNEITSNIQSVKSRIISQSASVTETHATMEQVTVNIGKLNDHVENQSSNIAQASSAIEQMVANTRSVTDTLVKNAANVKTLMGASEVGRAGLNEVAEDIQEISRESEGLLEINTMMESIASQTNLLSMNAAIEAAHAGEAGKGFAVVANEIRKLAESSGQQSKTISIILKKIKESIDKITIATNNVLNKFEAIDSNVRIVAQQQENIRHAMEEQDTGSKQILEGVGNINVITGHVKRSSQEMLEGSEEVIRESENLEKITLEITSGMNEMATGADEINVAVHHVNEITVKNRENIDHLMKEVSRFKVD